jgi:hypothetical protein
VRLYPSENRGEDNIVVENEREEVLYPAEKEGEGNILVERNTEITYPEHGDGTMVITEEIE